MNNFIKHISILIITLIIVCIAHVAQATHNRAGEIIIVPADTSCLTFKVYVKTYTKESSSADRAEFEILWGDGNTSKVVRVNGPIVGGEHQGESLGGDIKYNLYEGTHTYISAAGCFVVSIEDPNRNENILNMDNSVNVPLFLQSKICINSFTGCNSSPTLTNPPIGTACLNKKYEHNPGAVDPDGDSLTYELTTSLTTGGVPVPGYSYPQGMFIDANTGTVTWPQAGLKSGASLQGEFNFAIKISEWRRGNKPFKVGEVIRDMQVLVKACTNNPPVVKQINDTCVIAGTPLNININISDPDISDKLRLSATGQPFEFTTTQGKASVQTAPFTGYFNNPSNVGFSWNTSCFHVRTAPYSVYLKLADSDFDTLYDYSTFNIKVICPAVTGLTVVALGTSMNLSWNTAFCTEVNKYLVYRKEVCDNNTPTACETGMPSAWGYTLIGTTSGYANTTFVDNNNGAGLNTGTTYSYRIVAQLANSAQSIVSINKCAELKRDVPVMLNVDITSTNATTGSIYVRWTKPLASPINLDTLQYPGPYTFELLYSPSLDGSAASTVVKTVTSPYFATLNDTTFTHTNVNTSNGTANYNIVFYANGIKVGNKKASSVQLSAVTNDKRVTLSWTALVPWDNYKYRIFIKNNLTTLYDLIDSTTATTIDVKGLQNNVNYCFYVEAVGQYSTLTIYHPLLNKSQELCAIPTDKTAPCPPTVNIKALCDTSQNNITWNDARDLGCGYDVVKYTLYNVMNDTVNFVPLDSVIGTVTNYLHTNLTQSLAGCYYIIATDSAGNRSVASDTVCVENCPLFELPNIFTPNTDGTNDIFKAIKNKYIQEINLQIFDRWGALMFSSTTPNFTWDGTNYLTKRKCTDGVYYYVCSVTPYSVYKKNSFKVSGFLHLMQ
ncbi:MAG: gliding motility-associated C-terminal domain-containing protein [Bacteroidia bacterium]